MRALFLIAASGAVLTRTVIRAPRGVPNKTHTCTRPVAWNEDQPPCPNAQFKSQHGEDKVLLPLLRYIASRTAGPGTFVESE